MSILRTIVDDQGRRAASELRREQTSAELRRMEEAVLEAIVNRKLQNVASSLEALWTPLTRDAFPMYGVLDDIVLRIEGFEHAHLENVADRGNLVLAEFCVSVGALDRLGRPFHRRVGMLSLFGYESLYRTLTDEPAEYRATEVLKKLDF